MVGVEVETQLDGRHQPRRLPPCSVTGFPRRLSSDGRTVGSSLSVRRSGAAFVRTALLKKEVAQSRRRVRHKLRLLLLRSQHEPEQDAHAPISAMTTKARPRCRMGAAAPGLNLRRPDRIDMPLM